ncbi:hypothetical protein ACIPPS_31325 [Streptomyces sp. NPDC090127]|uniref:hypothetical protein n=1 Tax=Streptomyces sp. NPDC090127 TaxID=3365953 RepID=UPI0038189B03
MDPYCEPARAETAETAATGGTTRTTTGPTAAEGPPYAECVLCRKPTEYPESTKGITLCPVCAWREAERTACSG